MIGRMRAAVREQQRQGAFEPVAKRVRALLDGTTVVDSTRSALVWEPRRVVPSYAVPEDDILGEVVPDDRPPPPDDGIPALHPGIPFAVHTAPGERVLVRPAGGPDAAEGFRLTDPGVEGLVLLDFRGFDAWLEEDEPIVSHPRDPFHRVNTMRSVAACPGGARRRGAGRDAPAGAAVRDEPADARVHPAEDVRMDLLVPPAPTPPARTRATRATGRWRAPARRARTWRGATRRRCTTRGG